jgi:hypothetical protein
MSTYLPVEGLSAHSADTRAICTAICTGLSFCKSCYIYLSVQIEQIKHKTSQSYEMEVGGRERARRENLWRSALRQNMAICVVRSVT